MTFISVRLTDKELRLLTTLASDQLFRIEFIDSRMPGYRLDSSEMSMGKALVARLRSIADPGCAKRTPPARATG